MDKDQVAEILAGIGTLLELKGENPFKNHLRERRNVSRKRDFQICRNCHRYGFFNR